MNMELAKDVYSELSEEFEGTKALNSLVNIKAACDSIELSQGQMNFEKVGKLTAKNYGSPKPQSIQNNPKLKRYISARISEYSGFGSSNQVLAVANRNEATNSYPVEGLDFKTKTYIDNLRSHNEMLESRYNSMKKELEHLTKANPVNLAMAIASGPDVNGASLQIEYKQSDSTERQALRDAVRSILNLPDLTTALELEQRDDQTRMVLVRSTGNEIILTPLQYKVLTEIIQPHDNSKDLV
jgi:hypothetical protein